MKKSLFALSISALMMSGLVGCAANDNDNIGTQNVDNPRMLRQHTNDNNYRNLQDRNGNAYEIDDNEGPLTEMMDQDGEDRDNNTLMRRDNNQDRLNNRD